jgi:hypothetical protein
MMIAPFWGQIGTDGKEGSPSRGVCMCCNLSHIYISTVLVAIELIIMEIIYVMHILC